MKLSNKGFAVSTVMYIILITAIILILAILSILSSRKLILDNIKKEVADNINNEGTVDLQKNYTCEVPEIYYIFLDNENSKMVTLNWDLYDEDGNLVESGTIDYTYEGSDPHPNGFTATISCDGKAKADAILYIYEETDVFEDDLKYSCHYDTPVEVTIPYNDSFSDPFEGVDIYSSWYILKNGEIVSEGSAYIKNVKSPGDGCVENFKICEDSNYPAAERTVSVCYDASWDQ